MVKSLEQSASNRQLRSNKSVKGVGLASLFIHPITAPSKPRRLYLPYNVKQDGKVAREKPNDLQVGGWVCRGRGWGGVLRWFLAGNYYMIFIAGWGIYSFEIIEVSGVL